MFRFLLHIVAIAATYKTFDFADAFCNLNSIMEDNQITAQAQKEYYELANAASDRLRRAKALMDSKQPQYEQALSLLDEGLAVSGAVRRAGNNGDELMVRQNLACVALCKPAVSC